MKVFNRQAQLGEFFMTPGNVRALADQVNNEISTMGSDLTAQWTKGAITTAQFSPWRDFRREWTAYYEDIDYFDTLWQSTIARIRDFQDRAKDWYEHFEGLGVAFNAPKPKPPVAWLEKAIKWGAIGAIAIGATIVLNKAFKFLPAKPMQKLLGTGKSGGKS